ncbi:angiotensin-converting enzyme-like [Chrysoperla carnea]|uniref:angiotensin-converting enzyme-like n=1 Tax=Chrysoperla carnea TaxID=189513 RepID=UPI001D0911CF|nr:angiotensin-converting enzyme-like [Chrysoperla carnea]
MDILTRRRPLSCMSSVLFSASLQRTHCGVFISNLSKYNEGMKEVDSKDYLDEKMNSKIFLLIINICILLKLSQCEDLSTFVELIEYDYEDQCANTASISKHFLTDDLSDLYNLYSLLSDKTEADASFAKFQREQAIQLSSKENDNESLNRKVQLLTKIGDNLLSDSEISKIIDLKEDTEKMKLTSSIACLNDTNCSLYYNDVLHTLATSKDVDELEYVWSAWNTKFQKHENQLIEVVKLLKNAAEANGMYDVESYWDLLTEYTNSFRRVKTMWLEIEPLYLKLHKFVKDRLIFNKFMVEDGTEEIPIYLLGSPHANDWLKVADKILPHPQIYDKIVNTIKEKIIGGKAAYECAQILTNNMGLMNYNEQFWKNSRFNSRCPTSILNFCQSGNIEVVTCNETSLSKFIEANGIGLHISHSQLTGEDENNLSYSIRNPNRYSALTEGIKEIGHLLSIHPSNLHTQEIVYLHEFDIYSEKYHANETLLLLHALRILPRLAYYISADEWRLQVLENDTNDIDWWNLRQQYQRVTGNGNTSDYLYDLNLLHNSPYISKFLGVILQFQILDYFQTENEDEKSDIIEKLKENSNFKDLLKAGYTEEWPFLTDRYLRIEEVDTSALLTFFQPLEDYLDNAPLKRDTVAPIEITTTSTTPIPTTVVIEKVVSTGKNGLETSSNSAEHLNSSLVATSSENPDSMLLSASNLYIIIGCTILIVCAIIGGIAIVRLRTKKDTKEVRNNNRRFDA